MGAWVPILSSSGRAAAAQEALDAIVRAVVERDYQPSLGRHRAESDALLFAYLGVARGDLDWGSRATDTLNEAVDRVDELRGNGLYGGLCGLGWVVEHVSHLLGTGFPEAADASEPPSGDDGDGDEDLAEDVDQAIVLELQRARAGPWPGQYDLISGLVGYGAYFLERWPQPRALEGLALVLDHLEGLARPTEAGIAWFTGPELLPSWQREHCPDGYYNLGVAHGIPGVIHLLGELVAAGVERPRAERLLGGALTWLMAQKRPPGSRSWFSSWLAPGQSRDSRLTWCYGDLGIAAVLLQVARRSGRDDWSRFAHDLLDHCLAWPPESTGIAEAGLCHGAAGNAHIFNRISQAEDDPRCRQAALLWLDRALAIRQPGAGAGGFLARRQDGPSDPVRWEPSVAFLDGAIGVALAFLAALTPVEPNWDRLLLLTGRRWPAPAKSV